MKCACTFETGWDFSLDWHTILTGCNLCKALCMFKEINAESNLHIYAFLGLQQKLLSIALTFCGLCLKQILNKGSLNNFLYKKTLAVYR